MMPIHSALRRICLVLLVGLPMNSQTFTATAQSVSVLDAVVASGFEVAGHVEHHRSLPAAIDVAGESLTPSAWMQLAVRAVRNISGVDTGLPITGSWQMPTTVYPEIALEAVAYGSALGRDEYLAFLDHVVTAYPDGATLPPSFELRGAAFRFVDAFHLTASLLRFYSAYGYLPPIVDPKVATPRGLFPWSAPAGKETWLSALQNSNGEPYQSTNEYYRTSVLDYDMYALAIDIVGEATDPFVAGERLFDWSRSRYDTSPYGVNFDVDNLTGFVDDSWEMIRYMQGTSGKPSRINSGLFVAAGLVHGYDRRGYGGTLFTTGRGWYNAEIHAQYGDDVSANPFFLFEGDPTDRGPYAVDLTPNAPIFDEVAKITRMQSSTTSFRAFWINASDVQAWGSDALVQAASDGGFNTIVLTVKSFVGRLYFDTGASDNIGWDALGPLLHAARSHGGIKVLAAINTLADFELGKAEEWGQQISAGGNNEFFMSPCVAEYSDYMRRIIGALYSRYAVDGLILARNYVHSNGWANPECGTIVSASDQEKENYISGFANGLASHAKLLHRDRKVYYMTAPLLGNSGTSLDKYSHDARLARLSVADFDGVILALHGLAWLTPENVGSSLPSQQLWINYISSYATASSLPLLTMVHLSKEWMFSPSFYRGLAREYQSRGISGVLLTAVNSPEGEFGPAFVEQHFAKLPHMRFLDPPPALEVLTGLGTSEADKHGFALYDVHPNPTGGIVAIRFETSSPGAVAIHVYDIVGRRVATLTDGVFGGGSNHVTWDTQGASGGVYLIVGMSGTTTVSRLVVVR